MTRKSKGKFKFGMRSGFSIVVTLFLLILLLKNSEIAAREVASALKICATLLIPSLFPLTVASEVATETVAIESLTRRFRAPLAKLLGVSESATVPYFLGLLGGYTSSCKSAVLLLESGKISREDCESIIALSNMPSLAFLTGFVGGKILNNSTIGWILWGITVLSTLILGFFNRFLNKKRKGTPILHGYTYENKTNKSFSKILVDAISHSAQAMLIICACVVFFSVLISISRFALIDLGFSEQNAEILLGSLEITRGANSCLLIEGRIERVVSCAFLVGWSGLCVHFQIISLCDGVSLSYRRYFILKVLQGLICAALAYVAFGILKI